jgi:cytochrome c
MSTSERWKAVGLGFIAATVASSFLPAPAASQDPPPAIRAPAPGLGTPITERDVAAWDIDIAPDGQGLPTGSGTVPAGRKVYETRCIACHGAGGEKGIADRLVGGQGTLATKTPVRTIGSFWPYATTLYDYIHRAMPFDSPQSLSASDTYAVTAYLLHLNGLLPANGKVDAKSLPRIAMPNRDGFKVSDEQPDVVGSACVKDCPVAP